LLFVLVAGASSGAHATPPVCVQLRERVHKVYNFVPATSDEAFRTKKSLEMDDFWKWVETTPEAASCLPAELERADANGFFLFDGAQLLERSSTSAAARQSAAKAAARSDLNSVIAYDYVSFGRKLACEGADTTAMAKALLARERFDIDAFRAPHFIKLSRVEALLFLMAPLDPAQARPALTQWLKARTFPAAQEELIELAAVLYDAELQTTLAQLSTAQGISPDERKQLEKFLALEKKSGGKAQLSRIGFKLRLEKARQEGWIDFSSEEDLHDLKENVDAADLPLLREIARKIICEHGVNQHAVEHYAAFGELLQVALSQAKH
jgi:hypothetical protein